MRNGMPAIAIALAVLILSACSPPANGPDPVASPFTVGGDRPATVRVPVDFDPAEPRPLLLLLHGFGSSGADVAAWTGLATAATERGWLVVAPEGTTDQEGDRFWNAGTSGCCNLFDSSVDDSAYLSGLIDEISAAVTVDQERIFVFGHSNGGFMSYRMACDHADQVAAIISLAGVTIPETICSPSEPVATLQIHGTADLSIPYEGSGYSEPAPVMAQLWAAHDGCDPLAGTSSPALDLDKIVEGAETQVLSYDQRCEPGGSATLWTVEGGGHQPIPSADFAALLLDFFEQHPQP